MATRSRVVHEVARKRAAPRVTSIRVLVEHDDSSDESNLDSGDPEYADADAERQEAFRRGDFSFVGVVAEAEVVIEGVIQKLRSGGLWGIESDSGEEYVREVASEEYGDLRKILTSIGVPTSQLPIEFDPKWIDWRA